MNIVMCEEEMKDNINGFRTTFGKQAVVLEAFRKLIRSSVVRHCFVKYCHLCGDNHSFGENRNIVYAMMKKRAQGITVDVMKETL